DFSRLPELTADLLRQHPAVMHVGSPSAVRTAMAATKAIPIVFTMGEDPVKEGVVASFNRPGSNVTGFTDFANQLAGKRLGLLHDVVPRARSIAFLVDATNPNAEPDTQDIRTAAAMRGVELPVFGMGDDNNFERVFA